MIIWPLRGLGYLLEVLWVQNTRHVTSVDPLESQSSNQGGTDTATILGSEDLNRVIVVGVGLLRPVENLAQGHSATGLEVRVFVKHRPVGSNVAILVSLLLADGSNTTGRETSSASANEFGKAADELQLRAVADEVQPRGKGVIGLLKVFVRVPIWC